MGDCSSKPGCRVAAPVTGGRVLPPGGAPANGYGRGVGDHLRLVTDRPPIDVLLVDDHRLLADGVVRLLNREPDIAVVGVAATCAEALSAARELRPSVALLDFLLPDGDGLTLAAQLRSERPDLKLILLTGSGRTRALTGAVEAACEGYVAKTAAYDELVEVIRAVVAGRTVYPVEELARLPRVDQLRVHYQPVVDLVSNRPVGVEALVRWDDPARGLVSPAEFIAGAEESGFIGALGAAVMEASCRQTVMWRASLPGAEQLSVAVNVSARELDHDAYPERVARVLAETGLPPAALVIELTETSVAEDPRRVAGRLRMLRDLGVRVAVDDFGTGYASLQQLSQYAVDVLKVDRHFVGGLLHNRDHHAIVQATVRLAHDLALTVVAEGIETPDHERALRSIGCELGQGYLWARPLPADELAQWWTEQGTGRGGTPKGSAAAR